MTDTIRSIANSWCMPESALNSTQEILAWIAERNAATRVEIVKNRLSESDTWFYDREEGCIRNRNRSFFAITGFRGDGISQPIILQEEIGYNGILCREFDGVMHFLMQAKIEPGNVNQIQISPTIQATKSNFQQKHGGKLPAYLDYYLNAPRYEVVVDQLQSEQSSRFRKKRNRNIIVRVEEDIPVLPTHRWMTLGQLKRLMREDNLVNMDTRTVLSCIPFSVRALRKDELAELSGRFTDKALFRSVFQGEDSFPLPKVYGYLNNRKMFDAQDYRLVPLHTLEDWDMRDDAIVCRHPYPFQVVFCDISIEGREVKHWTQPLFEAAGVATFGLICCEEDGLLKFVVRATPEAGCMDVLELGPTVQREVSGYRITEDAVSSFFFERLAAGKGVVFDHLLSEEGGRFYHEQNRNVLLRIDRSELPDLPEDYFLLDYRMLNELVQVNNTLNIQLRNLLSLLEA